MSVLEKIEEIFGNPEKFSPENMERLVQETLHFFGDLKVKLESKDEQVRTQALETSEALKEKLEEQALVLCKSIGMDPKALEDFVSDPSQFTSEEWSTMQQTKDEMQAFKAELGIKLNSEALKAPKRKKPKTVKEWIVG